MVTHEEDSCDEEASTEEEVLVHRRISYYSMYGGEED